MAAWRRSDLQGPGQVRMMNRDREFRCDPGSWTTTCPTGSDAIRRNEKRRDTMSIEENVQLVKDFFAAMGSYNKRDLLELTAEDIEWIIPGEGWPLAGTHRGHAELAAV